MDVQSNWFAAAEINGDIYLQKLSDEESTFTIQMSEIEKQHGIRPFRSKLRGIRAISFDHVFNETYLGVMTTELCCVFDVRAPTAPIHVLSTQFCRPFLKSNLPTPFRSFAFCGNGCLLVLTDKDIFRWNYLEGTSTHLPSLFTHTEHSSFLKFEFKSADSLIGRFSHLL